MNISKGRIMRGQKLVVYGPEGIGKSTFASHMPGAVFIDTEGSTGLMDVMRMDPPSSWPMLFEEVDFALKNPDKVGTLVIDTADWAERLCTDFVLAKKQMSSIEDAGYGKGYVYVYEEFGKLLDKLTMLTYNGQNVCLTAHAMMRKFEQPDELGAYDRWELKMSKKVAPLVKEWADLLLFANYKTIVYATDKDGKKHKPSGGQRVMYTSHHPCWDAKNRAGLPDELPFSFDQIAKLFVVNDKPQESKESFVADTVGKSIPQIEAPVEVKSESQAKIDTSNLFTEVSTGDSVPPLVAAPAEIVNKEYADIPKELQDLMKSDDITPFEIRAAVASKGYFPLDTPFKNYPDDFVQGVLIGAWPQVKEMILKDRGNIPF